jgi:dTDP-4-amino-4,6-dideoxygalactose transaminase
MLEMQAAIGLIQIERMPEWTRRRTEIANRISQACANHPSIRVPEVPSWAQHAWYRFYCFVRPENLAEGWTRDRVIAEINAAGVPCLHGSAFDGTGWRPQERLPIAKQLGETSIALLVHPTLTDIEIDKTCSVVSQVLQQASR